MESMLSPLQRHPGLAVASFSLAFRAVHRLLRTLPLPKRVRHDDFRAWKWRNLSVSLVHSLLTGPWAIACVVLWPEILENIHTFYNPISYLLVCISTGYFVQDAGDIILSGRTRESWEFLLHHAMVVWTFLYSLFTRLYVAGAVVALFVEVNSVFLHTRLLFKLAGAQASQLYSLNRLLNVATYVLFRLGTQAYLSWYLLRNYSRLDHAPYFLCTLMLMNLMILVYFCRLLRADFLPRAMSHAAQNGIAGDNSRKFLNE